MRSQKGEKEDGSSLGNGEEEKGNEGSSCEDE